MDYQRFMAEIANLSEKRQALFQTILDEVTNWTTVKILQLLNIAVGSMEPGEVYCEIGCFQGASTIGALHDRPSVMAYAVDNFAEFDPFGDSCDKLIENISRFGLSEQVFFCQQDFEEFFFDLRSLDPEDKIGVYYYDGPHDYRSQLMALLLVRPFLAPKALILSSYGHWATTGQANIDFAAINPQCQLLLDFTDSQDRDAWNGLQIFSWNETPTEYSADFQPRRDRAALQAIWELQSTEKQKIRDNLYHRGRELESEGLLAAAERQYQSALRWDTDYVEAWYSLGLLYYNWGRNREAIDLLLQCIDREPDTAIYYYSLGLVWEKTNDIRMAFSAYQKALELDPGLMAAYNNQGNLLFKLGEWEKAESSYRQAIAANGDHFGSHLNLGKLLIAKGEIAAGIAAYKKAQRLQPENTDIIQNMARASALKNEPVAAWIYSGNQFYACGKYQEAANQYAKVLERQAGEVSLYENIGNCYERLREYPEAVAVYQAGIKIHPTAANLHLRLMLCLRESGKIAEAIAVGSRALQSVPEDLYLQINQRLLLPVIYENNQEIEVSRRRFAKGLEELQDRISMETPSERKRAMEAIGSYSNFFLACQGLNDRELQSEYGKLLHRIMAANYPQWVQPLPLPDKQGKIKIGYVSGSMRDHTVSKLTQGWLIHHNREEFEIFCYYIYSQQDDVTRKYRELSDRFYHIPNNIEAVCQQIRSDELHVLVFLDIGMLAQMNILASLRLAPIVCTTWAHPVTSGLPTVDYFLSSSLMEPENGQSHYTEALVCLPNIGIAYPSPQISAPRKTRGDFGLPEEGIIYLCSQTLFKYLPQFDYTIAAIARQVPACQFVFIARPNRYIAEKFRQRMQRSFAAAGLDSEEYCRILPPQDQQSYWNLNQVSDIFLDTLGWSGGHTTLEAIACSLPVVTCPGELMRSRHSYGILKMLGVTATIAAREAEYIAIAVRLGTDEQWRTQIVEEIIQGRPSLYDDKTCVAALEEFYQRVVREYNAVYPG